MSQAQSRWWSAEQAGRRGGIQPFRGPRRRAGGPSLIYFHGLSQTATKIFRHLENLKPLKDHSRNILADAIHSRKQPTTHIKVLAEAFSQIGIIAVNNVNNEKQCIVYAKNMFSHGSIHILANCKQRNNKFITSFRTKNIDFYIELRE